MHQNTYLSSERNDTRKIPPLRISKARILPPNEGRDVDRTRYLKKSKPANVKFKMKMDDLNRNILSEFSVPVSLDTMQHSEKDASIMTSNTAKEDDESKNHQTSSEASIISNMDSEKIEKTDSLILTKTDTNSQACSSVGVDEFPKLLSICLPYNEAEARNSSDELKSDEKFFSDKQDECQQNGDQVPRLSPIIVHTFDLASQLPHPRYPSHPPLLIPEYLYQQSNQQAQDAQNKNSHMLAELEAQQRSVSPSFTLKVQDRITGVQYSSFSSGEMQSHFIDTKLKSDESVQQKSDVRNLSKEYHNVESADSIHNVNRDIYSHNVTSTDIEANTVNEAVLKVKHFQKHHIVKSNKALVRDNKAAVRHNKAMVRDKKTMVRGNKSVVRDNKALVRDKKTMIRGNKAMVRDKTNVTVGENCDTNFSSIKCSIGSCDNSSESNCKKDSIALHSSNNSVEIVSQDNYSSITMNNDVIPSKKDLSANNGSHSSQTDPQYKEITLRNDNSSSSTRDSELIYSHNSHAPNSGSHSSQINPETKVIAALNNISHSTPYQQSQNADSEMRLLQTSPSMSISYNGILENSITKRLPTDNAPNTYMNSKSFASGRLLDPEAVKNLSQHIIQRTAERSRICLEEPINNTAEINKPSTNCNVTTDANFKEVEMCGKKSAEITERRNMNPTANECFETRLHSLPQSLRNNHITSQLLEWARNADPKSQKEATEQEILKNTYPTCSWVDNQNKKVPVSHFNPCELLTNYFVSNGNVIQKNQQIISETPEVLSLRNQILPEELCKYSGLQNPTEIFSKGEQKTVKSVKTHDHSDMLISHKQTGTIRATVEAVMCNSQPAAFRDFQNPCYMKLQDLQHYGPPKNVIMNSDKNAYEKLLPPNEYHISTYTTTDILPESPSLQLNSNNSLSTEGMYQAGVISVNQDLSNEPLDLSKHSSNRNKISDQITSEPHATVVRNDSRSSPKSHVNQSGSHLSPPAKHYLQLTDSDVMKHDYHYLSQGSALNCNQELTTPDILTFPRSYFTKSLPATPFYDKPSNIIQKSPLLESALLHNILPGDRTLLPFRNATVNSQSMHKSCPDIVNKNRYEPTTLPNNIVPETLQKQSNAASQQLSPLISNVHSQIPMTENAMSLASLSPATVIKPPFLWAREILSPVLLAPDSISDLSDNKNVISSAFATSAASSQLDWSASSAVRQNKGNSQPNSSLILKHPNDSLNIADSAQSKGISLAVENYFTNTSKENTYSALLLAKITSQSKKQFNSQVDSVFPQKVESHRNPVIDLTENDDEHELSSVWPRENHDSHHEFFGLTSMELNSLYAGTDYSKLDEVQTVAKHLKRHANMFGLENVTPSHSVEKYIKSMEASNELGRADSCQYSISDTKDLNTTATNPISQAYVHHDSSYLRDYSVQGNNDEDRNTKQSSSFSLKIVPAGKDVIAKKLRSAIASRMPPEEFIQKELLLPQTRVESEDTFLEFHQAENPISDNQSEKSISVHDNSTQRAAVTLLELSANPMYSTYTLNPESSGDYQEKVYQMLPVLNIHGSNKESTIQDWLTNSSSSGDCQSSQTSNTVRLTAQKSGRQAGRRAGRLPKDQHKAETKLNASRTLPSNSVIPNIDVSNEAQPFSKKQNINAKYAFPNIPANTQGAFSGYGLQVSSILCGTKPISSAGFSNILMTEMQAESPHQTRLVKPKYYDPRTTVGKESWKDMNILTFPHIPPFSTHVSKPEEICIEQANNNASSTQILTSSDNNVVFSQNVFSVIESNPASRTIFSTAPISAKTNSTEIHSIKTTIVTHKSNASAVCCKSATKVKKNYKLIRSTADAMNSSVLGRDLQASNSSTEPKLLVVSTDNKLAGNFVHTRVCTNTSNIISDVPVDNKVSKNESCTISTLPSKQISDSSVSGKQRRGRKQKSVLQMNEQEEKYKTHAQFNNLPPEPVSKTNISAISRNTQIVTSDGDIMENIADSTCSQDRSSALKCNTVKLCKKLKQTWQDMNRKRKRELTPSENCNSKLIGINSNEKYMGMLDETIEFQRVPSHSQRLV